MKISLGVIESDKSSTSSNDGLLSLLLCTYCTLGVAVVWSISGTFIKWELCDACGTITIDGDENFIVVSRHEVGRGPYVEKLKIQCYKSLCIVPML